MNSSGPYYSQFREDRLLEQIFKDKDAGTCVEVGAHDGVTGSNTYLFEKKGWRCVLVEPVPELCERMRRFRTGIVVNCAASSMPGETTFFVSESVESWSALHLTESQQARITTGEATVREITVLKRKLDDILDEARVSAVDFVSIDVEGHELEVLKGFSIEKFRPRIIIVEDNPDQEDTNVSIYLEGKRYTNFFRTGVNNWYAIKSDPITAPEYVNWLKSYQKQYEFEDRIKRRFAFLNGFLPVSTKNFLSTILRHISRIIK